MLRVLYCFYLITKISLRKHSNAKCPKFNIVGAEELDNLKLAQIIAQTQDKKLNYEMVDFHSSSLAMTYVMHLMVTR